MSRSTVHSIEVRELATGSVRKLPLTAVRLVALVEPRVPDEERLHLQDGDEKWELKTFDELKDRLRERYPDSGYERTLHSERDLEAEERWESGMRGLIKILADCAVEQMIEEEEVSSGPRRANGPSDGPSAKS